MKKLKPIPKGAKIEYEKADKIENIKFGKMKQFVAKKITHVVPGKRKIKN